MKEFPSSLDIGSINHFVVDPTGSSSSLQAGLLNQITTVFCTVEIVIWGNIFVFAAALVVVVLCDRAILLVMFFPLLFLLRKKFCTFLYASSSNTKSSNS